MTLIERLRAAAGLPEEVASDRRLLAATKGTYLRARIELVIRLEILTKAVRDEMIKVVK